MPSHHWLPFTQMSAFDANERTFVAGSGTRLTDARGRSVFDAISSVWVTVHGHGHPAIVEAIARQAARLDHATALGATNPVAEELADRLAAATGMDYVFFSGDGASAIEASLKMAIQFWRHAGQPERTRIARLRASYHGDTAGAMSVSDIAVFKANFGALCFESVEAHDLGDVAARDDVAAIVVEPLVQAAAGMRLVPPAAYAALRRDRRAPGTGGDGGPLLIVDEIATGFGRTGAMFAHERLGIRPDLLCLGKGITGGTLALSAVLATERIYDAFLGAQADARHFFHGHSYAGNPIACAAAIASLEVFAAEGTLDRAGRLERVLAAALEPLRAHPLVVDVRRAGLMAGVELDGERIAAGGAPTSGWRIANELYADGHFTRPIGSVVQLVPPLSSSQGELEAFCAALARRLDAAAAESAAGPGSVRLDSPSLSPA